MSSKYVYFFGDGKAEGTGEMRDVLGGKGAGLAEMTNAGLPVPPGFTIVTGSCVLYLESGGRLPDEVLREQEDALQKLERTPGPQARRSRRSAPRVGSLGREVLDAGHDGHDPESRPERSFGRRAGVEDR